MSSARVLVILASALCAGAVALAADAGPMPGLDPGASDVSIFYYPWFSTPRRDGTWAHWYVAGKDGSPEFSSRYYPKRGLYSSSNPSVVRAQMSEIAAIGVGTVVVSWWGIGSPEDARLKLVSALAREAGLAVAVHLEPYPGRTPATVVADIAHLRGLGVTNFYVYGAESDVASSWAEALANVEGALVFGETVHVRWAKEAGFDGVYTYDIGTWRGSMFRRLCAQAHQRGLLCAPSVGPGFDARLTTGDPLVRPRLDGATYDRMWSAAIAASADVVTITSYNEWQEATQIEPAREEVGRPGYEGAWGRRGVAAQAAYLDATARWVARFQASAGRSGRPG